MFEDMMNDKVSLVKQDGTLFKENIPALVQSKKIIMTDETLPIETGDSLLRKLPSGLVEEFIVDEPGFFAGLHGVDAHFQAVVHRSGRPAASPTTIINNIQGSNARVNVGSVDNSYNVAVSTGPSEIFQALRDRLDTADVKKDEASQVRAAIDNMERLNSEGKFKDGYVQFMAVAANHVAVFGPLLATLASYL